MATPTHLRRRARLAAAGALVASLAVSSVAMGQEADIKERLEDTREDLRDAKSLLEDLNTGVARASEVVELLDRKLANSRDLVAVDQVAAEAALAMQADALKAARVANAKLIGAIADRDATLAELALRTRVLDDRVRETYKRGVARHALPYLNVTDTRDVVRVQQVIDRVVGTESEVLADIIRLQTVLEAKQASAEALTVEAAAAKNLADLAAADAVRAAERAERTFAQVAVDQSQRESVLDRLESDQASHLQLVADLEAESTKLAKELAASQWRAGAPGPGQLVWPVDGRPGSQFGYRTHPIFRTRRLHTGVDIGAGTGTTIVAAAEGKVISSGWRGGYGQAVVIDHGGGLSTLYAHQSRLIARAGQIVSAGQKIGEVGSTGYSTGPHLHFEVRVNGEPRDPMKWY